MSNPLSTFRYWVKTVKQAARESCSLSGFSLDKFMRAVVSLVVAYLFFAYALKEADVVSGKLRWVAASILAFVVIFVLVLLWKLVSIPATTKQVDDETISQLRNKLNPPQFAHLRDVAQRLMQSYEYEKSAEPHERFSFWIRIHELKALGATESDLLHMAKNGIIEFGDDISRNGISGRGIMKNPSFGQRTVMGFTRAGAEWATTIFGIQPSENT